MVGKGAKGAAMVAVLASLGTVPGDALASDGPFLDTKSLGMHAKAGPPPVIPMKDLLTAPAENQFKQDKLAKTLGAAATVAETARPFRLATGYEGAGNIKTAAGQAALRGGAGFVMAGARYDHAGSYKDGNGDRVDFGYERDTEQMVVGWTPDADTALRLIAIRDYIGDDRQPHFSQDVVGTERLVGKAALTNKNAFGLFDSLETTLTVRDVDREADNFSLRPATARAMVDIDRRSYELASTGTFRIGPAENSVGMELGFDRHDAERIHLGPAISGVSAYRFPDVETRSASLFGDTMVPLTEIDRIKGGLRYDFASASAGDLADSGTTGNAVLDRGPATLYQRYYGTTIGDDVTDHNLSGRLRYERDLLAKNLTGFADFARLVRNPDNIERWHAVSGAGNQSWVGNPDIDAEKHHKLTLGTDYKSDAFLDYGRKKPDAGESFRIGASAHVDKVSDFITADRARLQAGVLQNDGAIVYRNVDARFIGANLDGQWNLTRNWSTRLNLAYQRGQNTTDNRALYKIAPLEATLLVDYQDYLGDLGTWNVGSRLRMVATQTRVDDSTATGLGGDTGGRTSGFAVLDLYGSVQINDRFAVMAGIDNILDKTYAEHVVGAHVESPDLTAVNAPGRSVFVRGMVNF